VPPGAARAGPNAITAIMTAKRTDIEIFFMFSSIPQKLVDFCVVALCNSLAIVYQNIDNISTKYG
jgi:hypothetical protein